MPFPVRLLAVAFITAMQLQRRIWLDVTRPVIIPLRLVVARLLNWPSWRPTGT